MVRPKTGKYWAVEVDGATELVNRLKRFDRETYKILEKEMNTASKQVADAARDKIPSDGLSNWGRWIERKVGGSTGSSGVISFVQSVTERSLSYDQSKIRRGVRPRVRTTRNGWRAIVQQMNPAGAIYMLAGSRLLKKEETLGPNLNGKRGNGPWPRALTPALYEKGTEAGDAIAAAVQRAMDKV